METTKTKEALIEYLKSNFNYGDDFEYSDKTEKVKELFGNYKIVDEAGNSEGGGEYSHYVIYFDELGCYIKVTGCYTSYNGTDWNNDWHEVCPKEKTITIYE